LGNTPAQILVQMAEGLARADKFPEALQIAAQIANDATERLGAAYGIALEQVRAGDFAGARQTISDCPDMPKKAAARRDFAGENKSASQLSKSIAKANVLRAAGLAQLEKGDRQAALATLDELRQLSEQNADEAELETIDLGDIGHFGRWTSRFTKFPPRLAQVDLEAALGEFEAARKTTSNLTSAIEKAQAFLFLGRSLLAAGKRAEARQALSRASRSAERVPVKGIGADWGDFAGHPRVQAAMVSERGPNGNKFAILNQIASLQARAGDVEGAFETVESFGSRASLDTLVVDLATGGAFEVAIDSLDKLVSTESKARALEGIGRVMCKQGEEKAAAALASKQKNPLLRAYTLLGMAIGTGTPAK
jgi:tetratricopeptide (TPR) repeat protein